jgi:hypothetical protein
MLLALFDSTAVEATQQGFDPVGKLLLQQRLQQQQQQRTSGQRQQPRQPMRQQQQPDAVQVFRTQAAAAADALQAFRTQQPDNPLWQETQEVQEMLQLLLTSQTIDGLQQQKPEQQQQHGSWQQRNGYPAQPTAAAAGLETDADQRARLRW